MSNLMRELYFADAFYYKDFENSSEMNKKLKDKILQWKHDDPEGMIISNSLGWQSRSIMQEDKVRWKDILKPINEFLQEVLISEQYVENSALEISNMWANINYSGGYNRPHIHPNSLFSGVYYIKTQQQCGNLVINDPRPGIQTTMPNRVKGQPPQGLWREAHLQPLQVE